MHLDNILLTLNGPWYNFETVSWCKALKALADRMGKKTRDYDF